MIDPFDNISTDETLFIPEDVELADWIGRQSPVIYDYEELILKENREAERRNSRRN
jgi:hypothetical protein